MFYLEVRVTDQGCHVDWQATAAARQHSINWNWHPGDEEARALNLLPAGVDVRPVTNQGQAVAGVIIERDYVPILGANNNAGRYEQYVRVQPDVGIIVTRTKGLAKGKGKGVALDDSIPGPAPDAHINDVTTPLEVEHEVHRDLDPPVNMEIDAVEDDLVA
jgi:hypothetical protein